MGPNVALNALHSRGAERLTVLRRLQQLWAAWRRVAKRIGDVQARLLLGLFYFLILAPFALVLRWRSDPLALKPGGPQGWQPKAGRPASGEAWASRQF